MVSQVPSCLRNAVLEGAGLQSQPSPFLLPQSQVHSHHPIACNRSGLSWPCPPRPGPCLQASSTPVSPCPCQATHWLSDSLMQSASCFLGSYCCFLFSQSVNRERPVFPRRWKDTVNLSGPLDPEPPFRGPRTLVMRMPDSDLSLFHACFWDIAAQPNCCRLETVAAPGRDILRRMGPQRWAAVSRSCKHR